MVQRAARHRRLPGSYQVKGGFLNIASAFGLGGYSSVGSVLKMIKKAIGFRFCVKRGEAPPRFYL